MPWLRATPAPIDTTTPSGRRWRRWLDAEIPELGERWRSPVNFGLALFAIGFATVVTVGAIFHHGIMAGPGFFDDGVSSHAVAAQTLAAIAQLQPRQSVLFFYVFLPLLLLLIVQNALVCHRSYSRFREVAGSDYSLRELAVFWGLNSTIVALLMLALALCALVWWLCGGNPADGWSVLRHITLFCQRMLAAVPTLVELPYPLPLIATILGVDLAAYWLHRLAHTRRLLWLLLHRPHHMTPNLMMAATQPVYAAAPLFLLYALPLQLLLGVSTKLFAPEPMIMEALLLRTACRGVDIYSHCAVYYEWSRENRPVRWLSAFFGVGSYHYFHHSAGREHTCINLGNWFFMCWDRVFGTYVEPPAQRPPTGLTGQPPLHMNPLRLALSGMLQIGYEWRRNPAWKTRWRIVCGTTAYTPPVSRDFAVHPVAARSPA